MRRWFMARAAMALALGVIASAPAWAQPHTSTAPEKVAPAHRSTALHSPEGAHADDHGPAYGLTTIDGMTALWTIIVFLALLAILRAAAWKPILKVLAEREKFIGDSLQKAKEEREKAEQLHQQYEDQLTRARANASAIVEEGRRDAEVVRRNIEEEARKEADAMVARAKREIQLATETAVKELYELTGTLATRAASRIIKKELNPQEHRRLIDEALDDFRAAKAGGTR